MSLLLSHVRRQDHSLGQESSFSFSEWSWSTSNGTKLPIFDIPDLTLVTPQNNSYRIDVLEEHIAKDIKVHITPVLETSVDPAVVKLMTLEMYPGPAGAKAKSRGIISNLCSPPPLGSPRPIEIVGKLSSVLLMGKIYPALVLSYLSSALVIEGRTWIQGFERKWTHKAICLRDREWCRYQR